MASLVKITYLTHASCLIEWNGVKVLTDPVFSRRIVCFKRIQPLTFRPEALPTPDVVCLTHAHYDHLDLFSYKFIPGHVPIIIPEGMSKAIAPFVNNPIIELSTWAVFPLKGIEFCPVPAKHPGGRLLLPTRYRTCHGYMLSREGKTLYLGGDTAYREDFPRLRERFPVKIFVANAAIPWKSWWVANKHMSVDEIIRCWEDLGEPVLIPIHWGTFFRNIHRTVDRIPLLFQQRASTRPKLKEKLRILYHGESAEFD